MHSDLDAELLAHITNRRPDAIEPLGEVGDAPLSYAQQRLWFLDQVNPGSTEYVNSVALSLRGALDLDALRAAFAALITRHAVLRTRFTEVDGEPRQVIDPGTGPHWTVLDLSDVADPAQRRQRAVRVVDEQTAQPMDLADAPLLRATVVRLGDDEHLLLVRAHHIVADGWSFGVLSGELTELYTAHRSGRDAELPALAVQYADFAVWQRDRLSGPVLEEQSAYWTQRLHGAEPVDLPTDRPRPAVRSGRGAAVTVEVPAALSDRLRATFDRHEITPFMGFLSVFGILLANHSGQQDVLVGTPVAGRNRAEVEDLVGFFVNTLVMRTDLTGDPTVAQLWAQVREDALDAFAHQDLPFERLVERLAPDRDLSRTPLFQHMFVLQNGAGQDWELPGLTTGPVASAEQTAKFDLSLFVEPRDGLFDLRFEYATDLFDEATVQRMAGHLLTLLAAVADRPDSPVSRLPMLTHAEQQQFDAWNDTAAEYPAEVCVHEIITRRAEQHPDRVAVTFGPVRLTYRELEQRSNQVAHRLLDHGVGPGSLVGICVQRGIEMVVGVLGTLKAGGAYVPLDPEYPAERLAFMLSDTAAPVVLTQQAVADRVPAAPGRQVLLLDDGGEDAYPDTDPGPLATPADLVYVIYTSGSTGTPKGVQLRHRSLVNFLTWASSAFPAAGGHGSMLHASFAFDFEVPSLFLPLVQGEDVVVLPSTRDWDAALVAELISGEVPFSTLKLTPSHLEILADTLDATGGVINARTLVVAGEPFPARLAERVRPLCAADTVLVNEYGPTEATVGSTTHVVPRDLAPAGAEIPIGRPVGNAELFILDPAGRVVPVGVAGELHIGGAGLALGYLNRPELTAERFVERAVGGRVRRLYRSGDLARWLPTGDVEFLGRLDNQVKVRGFRVELGELEAALRDCPQVAEAVVLARQDSPGDKRLVGYLVAADPAAGVDLPAVRAALRERLPEYMVPSAFVVLDAVPLTRNGKVDKRALPAPDSSRPDLADAYVAPRGTTQTAIAAVWSQVLGVDRVGAHDNFFELGGHSLLATRVVSRVRHDLGVELGVRAIFTAPTVAGLAALLDSVTDRAADRLLPPIHPVDRGAPLPLSFAQQRLWFLDQLEPGSSQYLIPLALRLHGELDPDALAAAVAGLVARHESLRTTFDQVDDTPVQVVHEAAAYPLDALYPPERARMIAEAALAPMDLRHGPLFRAALYRYGPAEHLLVLTLHHIIADGWSLGVLARELRELYAAHRDGRDADLPALAVQYADFAVWQRAWLRDDVLDEQLGYWTRQLDGVPPAQLPTDRPRPAIRSGRGDTVEFEVPAELSERLRSVFQQHAITPFMGFLAVFDILLANHTGVTDLAVGTPVAGRNHAGIEDLVGFFVNTLVLRTDLTDDPTVAQLWERVRDDALHAYAHQDVPFERLVDHLAPDRDLSRTPLFQHLFVLQNTEDRHWQLPGLRIESETVDSDLAKFDLTLGIEESPAHTYVGAFEYATDLFDRSTVERLVGHFRTLLAAVAADPAMRVSELPMLTPREQRQLVDGWNDTLVPHPNGMCVPELITQQARRGPDRVAVVSGDEQVTYRELEERANRVAHRLIEAGVGPEVLVGLCADRGTDLVVGLLGILKAGGAYVPLDPDYPAERLEFILRDTAAPVVLARRALLDRVPAAEGRSVLDLDDPTADTYPSTDPGPRATPGNLAYVIHTSGSTGTPKGVQVQHGNLTNLLTAVLDGLAPTTEDVWTNFHSFAFDFSVWEIFGPLATGARLVLLDRDVARNPAAFAELLVEQQVTVLNQTPSAFTAVQAALTAQQRRDSAVRLVIFGGEALQPAALRPWGRNRTGAAPRLLNMYGITEITVHATSADVAPETIGSTAPSVIGGPLANTEVHLLDDAGRIAPVGVVGEICVGGAGVARGYLNRPELTAQRFVELPVGGRVRRLYRSGDLARRLPDGNLEYLGRRDDQVKIRGFRVEPGEVEAALRGSPDVAEAVVLARSDDRAGKRLVAYLVPADAAAGVDVPAVRARLRAGLPEHLVPAAFMVLDALPLTRNGKVDKQALPAPDGSRPELAEVYTAPSGPVEHAIAEVWSQVLGVHRVGAHDNFFELGGDSILSIQVVSRVRRLGLALTPRMVFQHQTVARIAANIDPAGLPKAGQAKVTGSSPLTPIQHWFDERALARPDHVNQSVLLHTDDLDAAVLEQALTALTEHHDALRSRFRRDQHGELVQHYADTAGGPLVRCVDLSAERGDAVFERMREHADRVQADLDTEHGPVLRALLLDLGALGQRLLLVVHHLVVDGVSWRILLEDLGTAYQALATGATVLLPAKTTSYQDWSRRLRQRAGTAAAQAELAHWTGQPDADPLPRDGDGPNTVADAREVSFTLDEPTTEALLKDVPRVFGARINSVLLTAVALALNSWTGSPGFRIDLEGHGREDLFPDVDLSRTIGWFTSIFPVTLTLDPAHDPVGTLERVDRTLAAVPDNGVGHGVLRHLADPATRRALAAQPTPELSFNYLGRFDDALPGLGRLAPDTEPTGPDSDPGANRVHLLDVHGAVAGGRLTMAVTYSPFVHTDSTIRTLVHGIESALTESVRAAHARSDPEDQVQRHPLAPLQAGMLFHSLSGSAEVRPYVVQLVDEFVGDFDERAFAAAWQRLTRRHGVLRTSFVWDGVDEPRQLVQRHADLPITHQDWRGHGDQDAPLDALLAEDRAAGFDLATAPLMRFTVVRTAQDRRIVLWTFHHLLLDGWSVQLVQDEFGRLYTAEHDGSSAVLPEPGQYAQYLDWLGAQSRDGAEAFWRGQLDGIDTSTDLVGAANAAGGPTGAAEVELEWDRDRSRRLDEFARAHKVTVNTLVQAAWALVQSRYTGSTDTVHGTTVAGRPAELPQAQSTAGLFINTLPVRTRIAPAQTVADWLAALQQQHAELREHGHTGLTEIHGWSGIPRSTALFQSIVIFENYPKLIEEGAGLPGLTWNRLTGVEHTDYPLTVLAQGGDTFGFRLVYRTDRFDRPAIERMAGHLDTLLAAITSQPDSPVGDLPMLTDAETHQLLVRCNDTATTWPSAECAHDLITRQATRTPNATAVTSGGRQVTYRELEERANRIAHWLIGTGVGPDTLVGICLQRGIDAVAAVLGVLKAGGGYVPLAPDYPQDRLDFILDDVAAPVVLTQDALAGRFPGRRVCRLDGSDVDGQPSWCPDPRATPADLAYVLYTSGSTGMPKGVQIEHGSLSNLLHAMQDVLRISAADRLLAVTTTTFDIANLELLQPLVHGACIHLASSDQVHSPDVLASLLADDGITVFQSTPSLWKTVLDEITHHDRPLRILLGGEALSTQLVERTTARLPRCTVINGYGPTEASIYTTTMTLDGDDPQTSIPIGWPVANVELFVLDAADRPVPVGVVGELYIGGTGLARGYHNRPELTAERFVHKNIGGRTRRLYRTGDLVRRRPDGALDYLGRTDDQVKVRGFRIELGEIETALRAGPQVADAVVAARTDTGDKRLVAYLVPADPATGVDVPAVRALLLDRLPEYMVPAAFVTIDAIPLSGNGKVDKRALPAPDGDRRQLADAFVAPRGPLEHTIAEVWSQVLGVNRIGAHDNFFELGGDSILGIQVTSRIRRLGFALTPRMMFQHQTVARIAANIDHTGLPKASQAKVTGSSPLTPVQHWLVDRDLHHPHHFNQSVLLHVDDLDPDVLERALTAVAEHHDVLRSRFRTGPDGVPVQHYADTAGGPLVQHVDLRHEPDDRVFDTMRGHADVVQAALDLAHGPVLRAALFDLGGGRGQRLLLAVHHLVVDGVSWRVLLEDLGAACDSLRAGTTVLLPAKTTSYQDWAERLRQHAASAAATAEFDYWRSRPIGTPLPRQHPGPHTAADAEDLTFTLDEPTTDALLKDVPAVFGTQVNDALVAALVMAVRTWTGGSTAHLDLEGHGREDLFADVDLSRTVGWFTSMFPVAVPVEPDDGITDVLRRTHQVLDAVPDKGIGYGVLRHLGDEPTRAALRALPAPEIGFNYLGRFDTTLPGLGRYADDTDPTGRESDLREQRPHLLDVDAITEAGQLSVRVRAAFPVLSRPAVHRLVREFEDNLRELAAQARTAAHDTVPTVGDFPLADLDEAQLASILEGLTP